MTQLSNVPMQPNPNAIERPLTLVEKLEQERNGKSRLADYYKTVALEQFVGGLDTAIAIVKQHNEWVSVNERLPPNVTDEEKNYLLLIHKEWGCFIIGQYIKEDDEINSYMGNDPISDFAYWMPIPQPPSKAQDD